MNETFAEIKKIMRLWLPHCMHNFCLYILTKDEKGAKSVQLFSYS